MIIIKLLLNIKIDKIDNTNVQRVEKKQATLSNPSIWYTWKIIKSSYKNNKFEISSATWNDKIDKISDIQDNFKCITKKHIAK